MTEKDDLAIVELNKALKMLTSGKNPEKIQIKGCTEEVYELIIRFVTFSGYVKELYNFSTALASGNLDTVSPDKENFLAAGLKELHSRLSHLTWQVQQVSKGDYKQRVDFMGAFSDAFNNMTKKLEERENSLNAEIEKRILIEKELEYYAFTDTLTGVSNRRTGFLLLEKEINKSIRNGKVLSICFFDIDGLKMVNDVYGHHEGDYLIVTVSEIVTSLIRDIDTLCRMGGDEFLIILPDCSAIMAENVIQRVYAKIQEKNESGEKPYKLDFSYGIEEIADGKMEAMDDYINKADEKMYRNKTRKRV